MPSLLDKVNAQEAENKEKKTKVLEPVSKSVKKEKKEKKESAVKQITHNSSQKDKQISAKVNDDIYRQFTEINKRQGLSNNSALNMIINKYVRENKGLLEE
jgi:hypothetical protein